MFLYSRHYIFVLFTLESLPKILVEMDRSSYILLGHYTIGVILLILKTYYDHNANFGQILTTLELVRIQRYLISDRLCEKGKKTE